MAYFHGCAANYLDDGVGDSIIALLRRQGIEPALPPQRCSGTPIETYGYRDLVKEGARVNLKNFASYETVVTGCASCTLSLKDYPRLFQGQPEQAAAESLAQRVAHISEFLVNRDKSFNGKEKGLPRQNKTNQESHVPFILSSPSRWGYEGPSPDSFSTSREDLCRNARCRSVCRWGRDLCH